MKHLIGVLLMSMLPVTNGVCPVDPSSRAVDAPSPILLAQKGPQCMTGCWDELQTCTSKCNYAHIECRANCEIDGKAQPCQAACGPLLKNCHADCAKHNKVCRAGC